MPAERSTCVAAAILVTLAITPRAWSEEPTTAHPTYTPDGVVHVPAFDLPPSSLMSVQARDLLKLRGRRSGRPHTTPPENISAARAENDAHLAAYLEMMRARYSAHVIEQSIAGVPVRVFTPTDRPADPHRVLINLHGGGFSMCADACSVLESLPIAAIGGFKVVSVNYRMGPEATFPAASEDVAAVYRELLKSYRPQQIGIYGCSAGGALTAQVAAWLPAHGLPQAGALGVFGSGAGRYAAGDSPYVAAFIDGSFPPPGSAKPRFRSYFDGVDQDAPLVSPMLHPEVLSKFPPTLMITGTRAMDLSAAVYTHSQLVKVGVPGDLIVGEGLGHCYLYTPSLPEAQDAYSVIVRFFREHLG